MRDWWRRVVAQEAARLRKDGRAALLWSLRITVAAVSSYVVGTLFFPGTQPLLAPLTAMIVVQVTPVSLLATGIDRVVAVVAGVSLAVGFSVIVPLEWWSLGLLIFASITVGQALRLRSNLIEVAISGMLVLGVGSLGAESAASQRMAETLLGAAVGIAANLLFPPKVASADAGRAIDELADEISDLLDRAADELATGDGRDAAQAARDWLGQARRITHDIPRVGAALLHAERGRRLNLRAIRTPDVGPGLRQGMEALEHSAVAIRSMFRAVSDASTDPRWPHDAGAEDVLPGLRQTFRELATGVDAFGQLVRTEADPERRLSADDVQRLLHALDGLHEARARYDDLVTTRTTPLLLELHAAVLSTVKRLLSEMTLEQRIRRQIQLRPTGPRLRQRPTPTSTLRPHASHDPPSDATTHMLPEARTDRRDEPDR